MEALIHSNKHSVVYGRKTIDFSLLYCDRKTMEIAVHPDSTIIVKAPVQYDITLIEKKIDIFGNKGSVPYWLSGFWGTIRSSECFS